MPGFQLDAISVTRLKGVHPDLVKIVQDCAAHFAAPFIFGVSEGLRTRTEQERNVKAGVSETMHSRHLDGHAVDLVVLLLPDKKITWAWPVYEKLAVEMKAAAERVKVPIVWGGDWKSLKDGPHYELPWDIYPSKAMA